MKEKILKIPFILKGRQMNNWFFSDPHLGDDRLRTILNRPSDSVIIDNINSRVEENDCIICLGDFCMKLSGYAKNAPKLAFEYYRNQIKCKNIVFITGNHDEHNGVKSNIESMVIKYGGKRIYLTHNPKFAKEEFYWNFCGHCHGNEGTFRKLGKKSYIVDLSMDCWNFYPVNINEINQGFSNWLKKGKNEKTN